MSAKIEVGTIDFTLLPNPPLNTYIIAVDSNDGILKKKNSNGTVVDLEGTGGAAISGLTQNFISKSNAAGDGLVNSQIFDNGTNVGIGTTTPSHIFQIGDNTFSNTGITKRFALGAESGTIKGSQNNLKMLLSANTTLSNSVGWGIWSDGNEAKVELQLANNYVGYDIYQGTHLAYSFLSNPTQNGIYATQITRKSNIVGYGSGHYFALLDSNNDITQYASISGVINDNTAGSQDGDLILSTITSGVLSEKVKITSNNKVYLGVEPTPSYPDTNVGTVVNNGAIWSKYGLYVDTDIRNHSGNIVGNEIRIGDNGMITFWAEYSGPTDGQYSYGGQIYTAAQTLNIRGGLAGLNLLGGQTGTIGLSMDLSGRIGVGVVADVYTSLTVKGYGATSGTYTTRMMNSASVVAMSINDNGCTAFGVDPSNSFALVEFNSTTKAFLLMRMTTTQRDAITATNGMMIYNTTTDKFQGYAGGTWVDLH